MKPKSFPGQNVIFGENQPEYLPLSALRLPDGEVYTCWELTDEEIAIICENKCFYISQLTGNGSIQPILPMADLSTGITLT